MSKRRIQNLIILLALALITSCATSPTGRKQLMLVSPQTAIVESEKAYFSTISELSDNKKLAQDPALADRVARITGRVVTAAIQTFPKSSNWKWSVAIIDDADTVNAWCMAGGRMAVYTGLFEQLGLTDDEFAQIMGHEIAHALANHSAERMSIALASNAGLIATGIASDNSGITMTGAAIAAKLALQLPNSRTSESEADQIGLKLATLAGFEPAAAVTLWDKMGSLGGKRTPEFLSTHPSPDNRQQKLAVMVNSMKRLNPDSTLLSPHPVTIVNETNFK